MKKAKLIIAGLMVMCGLSVKAQAAISETVAGAEIAESDAGTTTAMAPAEAATDSVYAVVERMPEFPGGQARLFRYVYSQLQYPAMEAARRQQGRVVCQFVVEKDGSLTDIQVVRSSGYEALDNEAMRIISQMPQWRPGEMNDQVVRVRYTMPIHFKLEPIVVQPQFAGGTEAQVAYIEKNMKYPKDAKKALQEGTAICQFMVGEDGTISDPMVFVSTGVESLDNEAIRLVSSMPKWIAGTSDEKPTKMQAAMIINFSLPAEYVNKQVGNKVTATAEAEGRAVVGKLPVPACRERVKGEVVYKVLIGKDGKVLSVRNGEGDLMDQPEILELTRKAALKAVFAPAEQESVGEIRYIFE